MDEDLDRIERSIAIDADAERVWALVSTPGWWVNDDVLSDAAPVDLGGGRHRIDDPVHGAFTIETVVLEPPRRAVFRWVPEAGRDPAEGLLTTFTIADADGGVMLTVVETGLAAFGEADHRANAEGWRKELGLAAERLDRRQAAHDALLPIGVEEAWAALTEPARLASWYAYGGAELEPRPGGRVELRWDEHGAFRGEVLEIEAPARLVLLLALEPDLDPADGAATSIAFAVRPYGAGSAVSVRQTGYAALDARHGDPVELAELDRGSWRAGLPAIVEAASDAR